MTEAGRYLHVELVDVGVSARVELLTEVAPMVCRAIWDVLKTPLNTKTSHACFDGHEVFCFLPPIVTRPPLENQTMRPKVGEVMFFYAGANEFVATQQARLSGGSGIVCELAFMYGETDLRHFAEEGLRGSLVGVIDRDLQSFASACARTLETGSTALRITRAKG